MALKDCKFFADINGRQVEMDFDQFRAYLLQDNVMATLAPDLTGKRGKKAGFILTAQKTETAAVKAEESKGGVYPFTEHKKAVQVINSFEEGEFITNGTIIAVKSAISPKALSRIKSAERSKLRPVSKAIHDTWVNSFVKNAQEKASIAGVWQVDEKTSMALLQAETVIVPVDADQLKALYNLVQFDGVKVDYRDIGNAVIVTKNGEPAGAISPFNMKAMEQEHQITPETLRDVLKKPQSKAPVVPVKAEASTVKAEASTARAEAPSGNVVTVTAEPADAQRIADSVKTQKPDAQGFTKPQRAYLVEKAKEVYKEAQEASESTKFVIKVPGDGQFTVKTPTEANSLHRRLTGDNVPGVDAKDTQVERKPLIAGKKVGKTEIVTIGKAEGGHTPAFRWALQATAPSPARSKPFSRGLFTAKDKKGEFETKGSGAYPIELHEGGATVETILPSGDYITDGYMMVLRSAVTPAGLKKVKFDTSRKNTPNPDNVKSAWDKLVKDASVPAEIAGVFQSETQAGVALIDGPKGIVALNPDLVKSVLDLVKPDGVMVTPDSVEEAVIFTKNGKPVGAVQPLRGSSYKEDELEAALAFTKQESTSRPTLPLSAESLRKVQPSLSKDRAEALIQVLKAMGLPFDRIKLAKGETGAKGTLKQAALDAPASAAVREAAKKWAGVKEIKPAINPRLSTLSDELDQLRDNIERSLSKKSIDELIAMDPLMQMSFGSQDRYPVHLHSRLKATIVAYFSRLFNQPESEFVYNRYSEQWGVPKADLVRQADISTIIYPNENSFLKEKAEKRLGISKKSLLEQGRETFKTGQPVLVEVYHGTGAEGIVGNRFSASLAGKTTGAQSAQRGYFFAGSRHTAESYREQAGFILDPASHTNFTKGILYKFFVKMSNPLVYNMKGNEWREETFVSIMDRAKAAGHDGVIFTNTYDGGALDNIFTLFHGHENQIKSANPNTYDDQGKLIPQSERFQAETPDIRYQKGKKPKVVTAITGMTPQEAVEYFKKAKLVRPELAREILSKDVPEHLKPVTEFIFRQRQKFLDGKMTVRDVAKAYIITVSSIQAGAIGVDAIKASTGQTFPEYATMRGKTGDIQIRPEDAVSAWLLTPDGKKALDSLEQTGKVDEKLWQPLIDLRQAYGNNTLKTWAFSPKSKGVNLYKIEEMTRLINQTGGNPRKLEAAVQRLVGIKDAKAGFIKHLLGFGDTPTVDAREINFWLTGQADISSLKTKGAEVARAAKDAGGKVRQYVVKRIGNQIKDLAKQYDMDVNVGAHIVHHWLWDATSNEVTTHAVMMDAMELAQTAYHATRGLFAPEPGFPNGRFRLDKVNTGLGAQSFGHGIYIAEGKAGVTAYTEMLEEDAPGSVVYELDVPDGIVAKLATYEKPLTPKQFAALKAQVQSMLGEKAARAIAGLDKANTGDLIERIQDAIDSEDAGRQTSEAFSKAGIPGVKVEVSKDFGENKSFYVIWNQAALDRIALMKANEESLQTALEPTKQEEEAPPLGSIEFVDDLNAVISTFEGANESTILHEGFHFYRRHMLNEANGFTQAEINEFNDWAGAKDGVWTVPAEEKAARGFEKYLRTGLAPIPELKKLFQKVAKWLREVYKTLQGSEIDIEIPDNIRRVFDRIFTLEAERQKGATGTVQAETSARTLQQSNVKARDAEYMAAVKAGDTAKAQKMVDEAARKAGYNTPKLYHGTPSRFYVFDASKIGSNGRMLGPGFYFTTDKDTALGYTGQGGRVVTAYARSMKPLPYSSKPFNAFQMQKLLTSIALIEANSEPGGNWRDGFLSGYVYTYGVSLEAAVKEASRAFLNEEKALDQLGGIIGSGVDPAIVNQGLKASLGYDSYTATGYENRGFGGGDIYVLMESEQVKSADPVTYDDKGNVIPLSKRFEPSTPDIRYQKASTGPARLKQEKGGTPEEGPVFVDNVIEALKTWAPKGTPEQLKAHLAKVKGAVAEADWIGLPLFLEGRRSVTRDEVEQFVKDNQVTVREVVLSDEYSDSLRGQPLVQFRDWLQATSLERREFAKRSTVHSRHVLNPKAPAYRELLFLIPPQGARIITAPAGSRVHDPQFQYTSQPMPQEQAERELQERLKQPVRRFVHAGHYRRAKNSVVHVRFNERALADGTKVLFIEEIQSDWAQAKRQGQTDLSTPFQDTSRWTMLAFKRMLRWATDNQYDKIAWTTGTQQATRWSERVPRKPLVRTDVDKIEYKSIDRLGELKNLTVYTTSGKVERYNRVSEETIIREFGEKVYEAMPLINEYGSVNVKELGEKLAAEGESGPSLLSEIASMEVEADYDPNGEDGRRVLWDFTITYKNGDTKSVKNQTYSEIETTYGETLIDFLHSIGGAKTTLTQEELDELAKPEALSGTTKAMLKYYDQIVPTEVAKYVKPFEGKVTREALETGQGVHIVNVTEKMRKLAREGQALFQEKGKGAPGEPSATDVFRQKQAEARRKAAEAAMNRLRQATKEGQTKQASPAPSATTPPPKAAPSQPKTPGPSPSRPSTAGASTGASGQAGTSKPKVRKTIEQEVKDAIDRARKGKANPNNLPLDERLQRSIRGFADRFARRMVEAEAANIYQSDITLPDGSVVDRQEHFKDTLHDYAKAFLADDADGVTRARAVLEKILPERPPKPKVQKTAAERIKAAIERAERAANRKAASLTTEERIDREVKAFTDRFAKRMVWAKKAGTYTDDVILPDGTVVDRQTFFEQAVNDFMTAYQAGNMAGVSLAKSHMNMATEQVPPDVGFGIHSLRSPLSYSNVVGSYEGVMGPLGAEVSTAFKRFHQEVALKQKTMGEALAELRKVMRENYFPAMRDAGFYGMESIVTSHIDYIQAINNFSQNYRKVQESARLFKNPSKFVKSRLEFAKQANMISGAPQSNGWPMAASFMKAAVYLTKLKFNPKSALMNYSQVFLSAGPYFSPVELVAIIGKSHRPNVRNRVIDGMRLVDVAVRTTGGREVDEGPRKTVWDYLDIFRYSSEQTRVIGYLLGEAMADRIAADRAAKKDPPLLAPQRQEIIRDWIEKIEFDNSPWNVAPFFRERGLKGALFQFKPFVQKNVERLYADIRRNPTDYVSPKSGNAFGKAIEKALPESVRKYTKLIGYQVVIGGVGSVLTAIPVVKPIAGYLIYAGLLALAKSFGDDEEAEKAADAIYYGAPALVGVDLSNSVGYVETPHGKNIYEQLVNEFLGPAVSTTANIATQGAELYAEMNKPTPLGRPEQKAAKVERRVWDIAKAVTPTARPVEMAVTIGRGKQPELYLDKPTPLTRGEKIGRFAAFNPLRQSKFFDQKEAADWQKRLVGKVTEDPEIKRLEGEPDAKYARRQKMYQSWKPYYTRRMLSEPDFRLLSQEDKDAVLDNLKRNMVEETTKVSPDTDKFDAEEIIKRRLKRRRVED